MVNTWRYKIATIAYSQIHKFRRRLLPLRYLSPGEQYFKNGGNLQLIDFELSQDALCIDFGGYLGVWAKSISDKYDCFVMVYEPVGIFYKELVELFSEKSKVEIFPYGITNLNTKQWIHIDGAASGTHIKSEHKIFAEFRNASQLEAISKIDVVKINIEGGEYELIPELYQRGILPKISTVIIQFHATENQNLDFCRELLGKTHRVNWAYDLVWERWDRIPNFN